MGSNSLRNPDAKITFGIIVLNGEPFLRYNLRALYPFAHEIIVVEGASEQAAALATPDGHSTDGTLDTVRRFVEDEDPYNKLHIVTAEDEGHLDGFWPGEKDAQSRAYAERATGNILWQVDVDEFYHPDDMQAVVDLLLQDADVTGISFTWKNFWGGFDYLVDGWDYRRRNRVIGGCRRVFRWEPGFVYDKHRPPTVLDASGRDLIDGKWIGADETAARGIFCYHYGMVFPKQAREKTAYYSRMWRDHEGMHRWHEQQFQSLNRPLAVLHGTRPPSWLERFDGEHPPAVQSLIADLERGGLEEDRRPCADIEELLERPVYRACGSALDAIYRAASPIIQSVMPSRARVKQIRKQTDVLLKEALNLLGSRSVVLGLGGLAYRLFRNEGSDVLDAERILVVRPDQIGDVVMTSPFLRELRRNYPSAHITLAVKPALKNLVELCPHVDEVVVLDWYVEDRGKILRRHGRALDLARRKLWKRRFDLALIPRWETDDYHATYLAYVSGAVRRVAYTEKVSPKKACRNVGLDTLLTDTVNGQDGVRHEVERGLDFLRELGAAVTNNGLEVWTSAEDDEVVERFCASEGVLPNTDLVALGFSAGAARREWPLARFSELGKKLQANQHVQVVLLGGPSDRDRGRRLARQIGGRVLNAAGRFTLRQTGALLRRCSMYVGNDSGTMHLAAAAGIPVVEISCHPICAPDDHTNAPARFGPWNVPHRILQSRTAEPSCHGGCRSNDAHCICGVEIQDVLHAIEDLTESQSHKTLKHIV